MANVAPIFERMPQTARKETIGPSVVVFNLSGDGGGEWTVRVEQPDWSYLIKVERGRTEARPTTECMMTADDFVELASGKLDVQDAYFQGRIKLNGNSLFLSKLKQYFGG